MLPQRHRNKPPKRWITCSLVRCDGFRSEAPYGSRYGSNRNAKNQASLKVLKNKRNPLESDDSSGFLVAGTGFEPATSGLWARRATELLYPAILNSQEAAPQVPVYYNISFLNCQPSMANFLLSFSPSPTGKEISALFLLSLCRALPIVSCKIAFDDGARLNACFPNAVLLNSEYNRQKGLSTWVHKDILLVHICIGENADRNQWEGNWLQMMM